MSIQNLAIRALFFAVVSIHIGFTSSAKTDPLAKIIETSIYHDASKELAIRDILKLDSVGIFKPVKPVSNLGISSESTWIKVIVHNPASIQRNMYLRWKERLTHMVRFYEMGDFAIRESLAGHAVEDSIKEVVSNAICFPVAIPAQSTRTYFLKIDTPYNKEMHLSLVDDKQLDHDEQVFNLFAGAIFCALFVIGLYNLFLGFSLKDSVYFHFAAANIVESIASTTMLGLMPVMFPFIPFGNSPFMTTLSVGLFGIFSSNFIIQFLKLKLQDKLWYRIMLGIIVSEVFAIVHGSISYYLFEGTYILIAVNNLILINVAFVAVIVAYWKGSRDARFLVIGWSVLWFGLIVKLSTIIGFLPSSWLSDYFVYTSGVIESILLSFALADRFNRLQSEKLSLELDLSTKEQDLSLLAANNKIRHQERKNFISDLNSLTKYDSSELHGKLRSLITALTQGLNSEEKFIHKTENLDVLNSGFEQKLKAAYPQLSKTEVEMCGYVKISLSVKEIAEIRRTSEAAIKMARHRLKNKLELTNTSLDDFIRSEF